MGLANRVEIKEEMRNKGRRTLGTSHIGSHGIRVKVIYTEEKKSPEAEGSLNNLILKKVGNK